MPTTDVTASIDAPDAKAVAAALAEKGWRLTHILTTHHHGDHTAGNLALKKPTPSAPSSARAAKRRRSRASTRRWARATRSSSARTRCGCSTRPATPPGISPTVMPAASVAFVGDTLFAIGCGRVIEGNAQMMWQSLEKLMALPKETTIYCGHEYTQANAKFALTIEPENAALQKRAKEVDGCVRRASRRCPPTSASSSRPIRSCARTCQPSRSGWAWRAGPSGRSSARSGSARTAARSRSRWARTVTRLDADDIIRLLDLTPHPEGGHYRETFRDRCRSRRPCRIDGDLFPAAIRRNLALAPHRCRRGLALVRRRAAGADHRRAQRPANHPARPDLVAGERPQAVVPVNAWQQARKPRKLDSRRMHRGAGFRLRRLRAPRRRTSSPIEPGRATACHRPVTAKRSRRLNRVYPHPGRGLRGTQVTGSSTRC